MFMSEGWRCATKDKPEYRTPNQTMVNMCTSRDGSKPFERKSSSDGEERTNSSITDEGDQQWTKDPAFIWWTGT